MEKINFVNNQAPAINGSNLNQLQTNVENAIEEKHIYSTTEKAAGVWIDGKILYKRVYDCGKLKNAGITTISTGLSNVNYIDWTGIAIYVDGGSTAWPYNMATGNVSSDVSKLTISDDNIIIESISDLSSYTGYVTILYTKN